MCMPPADCSSASCWCTLHGPCNLDLLLLSPPAEPYLPFTGLLDVFQLWAPTAQAFWV